MATATAMDTGMGMVEATAVAAGVTAAIATAVVIVVVTTRRATEIARAALTKVGGTGTAAVQAAAVATVGATEAVAMAQAIRRLPRRCQVLRGLR